jgi:hypothetical protein
MVWYTLLIDRSMNTELSLAMSIEMPGGRSACSLGIMARTPRLSSSGLAVAWRITPAVMATLPLSVHRCARQRRASCTRATSRMRTGKPLAFLMMMSRTARPRQVGLRGHAELALGATRCGRPAPPGCCGGWRPPRPGGQFVGGQLVRVQPHAHGVLALAEDAHIGCAGHRLQARLDDAVDQVVDLQPLRVSLVNASQITGKASASTLAMTGSSMACGSLLRTREVRSRTSAAAESASFSSRKRT